jgi:hypothetical protein
MKLVIGFCFDWGGERMVVLAYGGLGICLSSIQIYGLLSVVASLSLIVGNNNVILQDNYYYNK